MKTKTSPKMTVKQKRSNGWHFLIRHKEGSIPQHMQLWRLRQPGQNHSGGIPAERESEQKTAHGLFVPYIFQNMFYKYRKHFKNTVLPHLQKDHIF